MECKIVNFEKSPVDRKAIQDFLGLLPNRLTQGLNEISYQSADSIDLGKRLREQDKHRLKGLHFNQDGNSFLILIGPPSTSHDIENLYFIGRLKSLLLKLLTSRVAWDQTSHEDLIRRALSVDPAESQCKEWKQALANHLFSLGHRSEQAQELCDQANILLEQDGYDAPNSVFNISEWQKSLLRNYSQRMIKNMIKQSIQDSYERARLMHAIFSDGDYNLEPDLLEHLRLLVTTGDPHRLAVAHRFAKTLNEI